MVRGSDEWHLFVVSVVRNPAFPASEVKAQVMALAAHRGQTDQVGAAYIGHPAAVVRLMQDTDVYRGLAAADRRAARCAAWLHDTVEDTAVTVDDLRDAGFGEDVVVVVVAAVSARAGEPKSAYYARVTEAGGVALAVKLGDLAHNTSPDRRRDLPGSPTNQVPPRQVGDPKVDRWTRLGRKYFVAYQALGVRPPEHLAQFASPTVVAPGPGPGRGRAGR